jgi:hypothetical protein
MKPSNQPSLADLTNQMKQLTQSLEHSGGGKDLQMSPQAHQQYIKLVTEFRQTLRDQRDTAALLTDYGNVGSFNSALETKEYLASTVTSNAVAALDQYIAYLDQFQNAVSAAFKKIQAEDQAS